jgi:hypothetical protein
MIDKFDFDFNEKKVKEPIINGMLLSQAIDFYYENILDMIEKLMCYFYGINAHLRSNRNLKLFIVKDFDYKNLKYKFIISIARFDNLLDCDYK